MCVRGGGGVGLHLDGHEEAGDHITEYKVHDVHVVLVVDRVFFIV